MGIYSDLTGDEVLDLLAGLNGKPSTSSTGASCKSVWNFRTAICAAVCGNTARA